MQIISLEHIKSILPQVDLIQEIESGFKAYSNDLVVVPPVGELSFQSPPCLLYTSPSPRDRTRSRMPSSA